MCAVVRLVFWGWVLCFLLCVLFCVVWYELFIGCVFVIVCACFDMSLCVLFVLHCVLLSVFVLLCLCEFV